MESVGRWTPYKWCLLFSVTTVFIYGLVGMTCAIATWFRTWMHADVMYVADYDILVLVTLSASILLLTSIVGLTGTLLNSRAILAVYALLLWPSLISMLSIGYTSYRRSALSLDRKLNLAWSQWYTPLGRLIIQDSLQCCGYYNALHDATPSRRCFSRTALPGCKSRLYRFEQENLGMVWAMVFSLVPLHIFNIFVALLCANHVTKRFGKGITPKGYRLTRADLKVPDGGMDAVLLPRLSRAPSIAVFREDRAR
ncbi:hypothetical protein OE88DRAFT_1713886 [Heliocybe sulcata]|uniref:Tetraspanin Tsp2 n=1 Tax=Heliocybe sulcata TaxID=5364 RepID=A0A5C3MYE2_9AGAM|nr:hypothetical protein OE88DRAFT_1713886 [Heliocybe sulcata]